jgi:hypothetical protein
MALHNCWTPPGWFFPGLAFGAALNDPAVALAYLGPENRSGQAVQHLQFWRVVSGSVTGSAMVARLSKVDVYLDGASYLPAAFDYNVHSDANAGLDIPVEMSYANYRTVNGALVPFHLQQFLQRSRVLDLNISTITLNSGLTESDFAI